MAVAPRSSFVFDAHVFAGVIRHEVAYSFLPLLNSVSRTVVIHKPVSRSYEALQLVDVDLLKLGDANHTLHKFSHSSPLGRVLLGRIIAVTGSEGVVVVVRYEEYLVVQFIQ